MGRRISEQEQSFIAYFLQAPQPQTLPDAGTGVTLAAEWQTYKREAARLLAEGHQGRFALIKNDTVLSVWDTEGDAFQAGRLQLGREPFMVHRIQVVERPVRFGYYRPCNS